MPFLSRFNGLTNNSLSSECAPFLLSDEALLIYKSKTKSLQNRAVLRLRGGFSFAFFSEISWANFSQGTLNINHKISQK